MSSIYQQLTESDLKVEKDIRTLATAPLTRPKALPPKLTGIKTALWGAYFIALLAICGGIYLYYIISLESQHRLSLEATHVTLSRRTVSLESAIEAQKNTLQQVGEKLSQSISKEERERSEIKREIDKRRLEIADLQKVLQSMQGTAVFPTDGNPAGGDAAANSGPRVENMVAVSDVANGAGAPVVVNEETAMNPTPMDSAPEAAVETPIPAAPVAQVPVTASAAAAPAQKVLTVNRQFKFVVVNLGQADSVHVGDKIQILRSGQPIGIVQIEKLYDSFSAATILQEDPNNLIDVGDAIQKAA